MGVTIKSRHVVKPAKPTWNGIISLTELEQTAFINHTPLVYIYPKPTQTLLHPSYARKDLILETIRDSLSRILVPYYPFAGRFRWVGNGGRAELECNAMGSLLIEAESHNKISDFGDFLSIDFQGLVPEVDYKLPIEELPILLVQLTWFKCGGIGLGIQLSHMIADGHAYFYFLGEWANLARGISRPCTPISPSLDRRNIQNQGIDPCQQVDSFYPLPKLMETDNDEEERQKEVLSKTLILSKKQIDSLMKKAAENNEACGETKHEYDRQPWSQNEVITAHIWRCASKARGHSSHQNTALCFAIDSRRWLNPPLPSSYLGDAVVIAVVNSLAGELTSTPLANVCRRIREEKKKTMSDNFIRSTIKFFKAQKTLFKYQGRDSFGGPEGAYFGNPNILVSSVLSFTKRGLDFGWGKEIYLGTAAQQFDGDIIIVPGFDNDGSIAISVGFQAEHMKKFEKYLYMDIDENQDASNSTRNSTFIFSRY